MLDPGYVGVVSDFPNIYKEARKLSVHYATFLASVPYSCRMIRFRKQMLGLVCV